ncbi:molybdenum cofactor biosynthesis protein MoaE [Flavobacterium sp. ZB4P23]|uniref:molybdenum cofactor biosynthesis protein MoaE n=1 Tax=unclassified Flavobacterium TaxID=196869 RepID=UPI000F82969B|nr:MULTISPECIES: molybdenum cofactor biosynthesis protein MoaE [unclassified Flavobacterium]RTY69618.1 molybdenum cofactor biosynthesis protein MoaE [Flavobacterium sp. LB2P53]RTY84509.1 molybdenum cofactor biosynthesis protein MoaE [Flavobacterium sp. ZB4P23]RTY96620.1 molybdenum cofactor biosynthesis protein MoaE [Flavobacterium sp. GSN2]RTZ05823.1 molybdenum cofactor biosynthesis protein MoaE [Flavobacterium sp. GSP6]
MIKKIKNIFIEGAIPPLFIADSIAKHATKKNIGAHSIFLGQIREDVVDGKTVKAIEYSAYEAMALEKMQEIREELFSKYELSCMHVHHSLGVVNAGEICLFVFTSSKHRNIAMEACNEIVERVKAELQIWGKEIFNDQSHQWKINS